MLTVKRFRLQPWNSCAPPIASKTLQPGRRLRWYVLFSIRVIPRASTCCAERPLIAAWVATGINVGSNVVPSRDVFRFWSMLRIFKRNKRLRVMAETLALVVWHFAKISNCIHFKLSTSKQAGYVRRKACTYICKKCTQTSSTSHSLQLARGLLGKTECLKACIEWTEKSCLSRQIYHKSTTTPQF